MTTPRPEHPRPDFERANWHNLNGAWQFAFDDTDVGKAEKWYQGDHKFPQTIIVPFCYQSERSGIADTSRHDTVWYRRMFVLPDSFYGRRVMLRFGAVDHTTDVWVNGQYCGCHVGGYTSFFFDISDLLTSGENTIAVRAHDDGEATDQLRGKQRWMDKSFGCWYTPCAGIWQTVWLEAVPALHLQKVKMTPDADEGMLRCEAYLSRKPEGQTLAVEITFGGALVASATFKALERVMCFDIDLSSSQAEWKYHLWEPEAPNLYDITFTLGGDYVKSYFGLRKVSVRGNRVLLNNRPLYQRLILDQGYYDGGLLTAPDDQDFARDLEMIRALGFNGLRKHQKVEDPRFLYWCDKLGILVWAEMGSAYSFNDLMMTENTRQWQEAIGRDYNHPSIIVWTLLNESWGIPHILSDARQQAHSMALYYQAKAYDPTRLVVSNDGWEHTVSDIITFHDYTQDGKLLAKRIATLQNIVEGPIASVGNSLGYKYTLANGFAYGGQPLLLSECCGTAFAGTAGWGYGQGVASEEEYLERHRSLIGAIYSAEHLSGFCVTQFTDVEQEVNGIVTMDRRPKVDVDAFSRIIRGEV